MTTPLRKLTKEDRDRLLPAILELNPVLVTCTPANEAYTRELFAGSGAEIVVLDAIPSPQPTDSANEKP
jgi:hypothetical protein